MLVSVSVSFQSSLSVYLRLNLFTLKPAIHVLYSVRPFHTFDFILISQALVYQDLSILTQSNENNIQCKKK